MANIAINGMGRIGRAALKQIQDLPDLELVAVNDLIDIENIAYLLKYDTVYGRMPQAVSVQDGELKVGDHTIRFLQERDPANLPWGELGIDIVLECTGVFRKSKDLQKHLHAGARSVILSAPAKDDEVMTIVYGVNQSEVKEGHIVSCASCTTNCITPVVEVIDRRIGIQKALMTTIHAYTASQGIVDGPSSKWRRGRAGAANLVPTTTGAALATTKALPQLEGRFDGVAVRAPVPAGSVADMTFLVKRATTIDEVNSILREEAGTDRYRGILGTTDDSIVSSDILGDPHASIVDLQMTQVVDQDLVKIMSWYDNEWGYTRQMLREAENVAQNLPAKAGKD
ncbi:MAG: type I glyceraldehyde-3-phosphate dehydrogenase [Anaerolineales bacterium]|jgi:glyceraldehyde 3-phosphate dehydrogenase